MLEQLFIFTRGGLILWTCKELGNALKGSPIDILIRSCLLEERSGSTSYNYDVPGAAYTLKWTFHNELGLVFVAVYQRILHLLYVDDLLMMVKKEFSKIYDPKRTLYNDFDDIFQQLRKEAEARVEEMKKSKQAGKPMKNTLAKKQGQVQRGMFDGGNKKSESGDDGGDDKVKNRSLENGNSNCSFENESLPAEGADKVKENVSSKTGAFDVNKLQKLRSKGGKKTETVVKKGSKAEPKKIMKKNRVWDDSPSKAKLDFTDHVSEDEVQNVAAVAVDQGESMMDKEEIINDSESEEDDEEPEEDSKVDTKKKWWFSSMFQSIAGKANLEKADLELPLKALKDMLMTKNVAEEIAEKLCESVAASLEGKKQASFTRISSIVKAAMEEALVRILTPKRSIDILRDVHAAKEQGKPYVVVFVGVNGVGKSTNLAKVAYWLLQHKINVMMAACDTFRSGAVEQLRTHARRLQIPIFEKGYEKDPAIVAKEAIQEASRNGSDVVLVDTAGRMQDNEPLMRALSKLIYVNNPDLVLFVGEAHVFVLSECVDQFGPTEDAVRALLDHGFRLTDSYRFSQSEGIEQDEIWDFRLTRLRLLHLKDRLETFLGINTGRFSVQEYKKFCNLSIKEAAIGLGESGKIGALNLLFKRHPYSLTSCMLDVLSAIPETIPVQTYGQLLPGSSPPPNITLREEDWVECFEMVAFISKLPENNESNIQIRTEPIIKQSMEYQWPSITELSSWYKNRARDIDNFSGQLDNCISLIDVACRKGIYQLKPFLEDILYLNELIYSDEDEDAMNLSMSLATWENLSDYERFKLMLVGVNEENVIQRLHNKAVPFMKKRLHSMTVVSRDEEQPSTLVNSSESFLVRWLKDIASQNKLEMCLIVIEEGCKEIHNNCYFTDDAELVDCALQCIYLCSVTDRWSTMASILSKLPNTGEFDDARLKERLRLAEGHVEAGRLFAYYQVPKPISFFLGADSDGKGIKQIVRLILSKFIRRQPVQMDNDWANMWRDLQYLQEKAFPFIDLEYVLIEFCRGLLKAGKFSLARSYLRGAGSVSLATDKAENLVIQAAREYFFSASSLSCSEIWKAKECLNIFPNNRSVIAEADIIDAVTVKLPSLGVNLLPMQFKQIKDPMEIIKLAITSHSGAYLNVDEIIEIAKLLGLSSQDDISAVQEAIAREAAVVGDLQLAFDLCLILAKKGHGSAWDLCAALARGPALDNMDISSRKRLLGFALSHCDGESIGELLHGWKDLDIQGQCESLIIMTGKEPQPISVQDSSYPLHGANRVQDISFFDQDAQLNHIKDFLFQVAKDLHLEGDVGLESILRDNGKILSFAATQLPWLLELSQVAGSGKKFLSGSVSGKQYISARTQAIVAILSWLARNGFAPKDTLVASLAKSIMEPPVTEEEDIIGCSYLLNLVDALNGVGIIEENLRTRENYSERTSIMNVGMIYGLLNNSGAKSEEPAQRRELILRNFQQKNKPITSDERDRIDKAQSTFWKAWKLKLEEQKRLADHSRVLEQIIPGVEAARFLSGDTGYKESAILSLIESVKLEKKHIFKDVSNLAHTYGLDRCKLILHYLKSIFLSEAWSVHDITAEVSEFKGELRDCAVETIKCFSWSIYPSLNGYDKDRLALMYSILSDCYSRLTELKELTPIMEQDFVCRTSTWFAHFYKVAEQECNRVSSIMGLNFKNIAGLQGLNFDCFNTEVCAHINENNVDLLAKMVQNLLDVCEDPVPDGFLSWQDVYGHHILGLLTALETKGKSETDLESSENIHDFLTELEQTYDICRKYLKFISTPSFIDITRRFLTVIVPAVKCLKPESCNPGWQVCLVMFVDIWLRILNDMLEIAFLETSSEKFVSECLVICLKTFRSLIVQEKISSSQGWVTVLCLLSYGLVSDVAEEIYNFCRAMILSGCGFEAISDVFAEATKQNLCERTLITNPHKGFTGTQDLQHLYLIVLNNMLQELASQSLEYQYLHHFLSSLSRLEGDLVTLKSIRQAVWDRMAEFSDNIELPSHVRVYILELMQFVAASTRHMKGFSSQFQASVLPWEGWENMQSANASSKKTVDDGIPNRADASSSLTNTLVALRSTQLVSAISPSIEVTPEDLLTVEAAVSCFVKICSSAVSISHVNTLLDILREWEGLFSGGKVEAESGDVSDGGNSWGNDDWDEGWESFQEDPVQPETKKDYVSFSIHPLHVCWMEIFKKLLMLSQYQDMLKLIDQSNARSNEVLLDEDGARSLSQIALEIDYLLSLKLMLLFPYKAVQLQCLDVVEHKLKHEGISDKIRRDHQFLVLVLSSGVISTIITNSSYGTVFSCICYMVGNLSRQCQESQSSKIGSGGSVEGDNIKDMLLLTKLVLPCFISELVSAEQHILAGLLVTKFMHTNASVSLLNIAGASLRKYLETQIQILPGIESSWDNTHSSELLVNTLSSLKGQLGSLMQSSLSLLPVDG